MLLALWRSLIGAWGGVAKLSLLKLLDPNAPVKIHFHLSSEYLQ